METVYKRLRLPQKGRLLLISDIHGHLALFRKLLERAAFSREDTLVIVGDMLEKGPESLATLRYVMRLCEEGNVFPLIGNVDAWRLLMLRELSEETAPNFFAYLEDMRNWCGSSFFDEMAAEIGYPRPDADTLLALKPKLLAHFAPELRFLENLPVILETERYSFVHGGLRRPIPEENCTEEAFSLLKYDAFVQNTPHRFQKTVVTGHWPLALYCDTLASTRPRFDAEKNILSIDGGCGIHAFGQLNLVVLPRTDAPPEERIVLTEDKHRKIQALQAQEADEDPFFLGWVGPGADVLEEGTQKSRVRLRKGGREAFIPNDFLYSGGRVGNYTNYRLSVKAGDVLSLAKEYPYGCYAVKDGIVGWYTGTWRELPAEGV